MAAPPPPPPAPPEPGDCLDGCTDQVTEHGLFADADAWTHQQHAGCRCARPGSNQGHSAFPRVVDLSRENAGGLSSIDGDRFRFHLAALGGGTATVVKPQAPLPCQPNPPIPQFPMLLSQLGLLSSLFPNHRRTAMLGPTPLVMGKIVLMVPCWQLPLPMQGLMEENSVGPGSRHLMLIGLIVCALRTTSERDKEINKFGHPSALDGMDKLRDLLSDVHHCGCHCPGQQRGFVKMKARLKVVRNWNGVVEITLCNIKSPNRANNVQNFIICGSCHAQFGPSEMSDWTPQEFSQRWNHVVLAETRAHCDVDQANQKCPGSHEA